MWLNFFLVFGFVVGVLAIPGFGAALDAAISEQAKQRVRVWTARQSDNMREARFGGSKVFDRLFGSRIVSRRALVLTIFLSTFSIAAGFSIAYFTSGKEIQRNMFPIVDRVTTFNIFVVIVFATFIILGDFLSYAQTRIFFSALDRIKNIYVSTILYAADIVLSLGIFVFAYSIARTIVTVAAITIFYQHNHEVVSRISPEVVLESVNVWNLKESQSITGNLARALRAYRVTPSSETAKGLDREIINLTYAHPEKVISKSSLPIVYCLSDFSIESESKTHIYELLRDSEMLANRAIALGVGSATFGGEASFSRSLPKPRSGDLCAIHVVERTSTISMSKMMSEITWGDFVLGSVAMTMHGVETSIATKFSALMYEDPISSAPQLMQYALMAANSRVLGIGQRRVSADVSISIPAGNPGHIFVPFSILAFSSLGANLVFALYIITGLVISMGDWFINLPPISKHVKEDAIFFRLSMSIAVFVVVVVFAIFSVEEMFNGLLWLVFQRA